MCDGWNAEPASAPGVGSGVTFPPLLTPTFAGQIIRSRSDVAGGLIAASSLSSGVFGLIAGERLVAPSTGYAGRRVSQPPDADSPCPSVT